MPRHEFDGDNLFATPELMAPAQLMLRGDAADDFARHWSEAVDVYC